MGCTASATGNYEVQDSGSVPDVDVDGANNAGDGANDFSGTTMTAEFTPEAGLAGDCAASSTETYIVDDDGDANRSGASVVLKGKVKVAGTNGKADRYVTCSYDLVLSDMCNNFRIWQ